MMDILNDKKDRDVILKCLAWM